MAQRAAPSIVESHFEFDDCFITSLNIISNARPMTVNAIDRVAFDENSKPFVICDYGAADGLVSLGIMKELIAQIKQKHGKGQQIILVYEDVPENDFTPLFKVLSGHEQGPSAYSLESDNVFVMATGRSFYSQCCPDGFINLGYSMVAMQRLSKSPCCLTDALDYFESSNISERKMFADQAAMDWDTILLQRAKELAPGGQLVIGLTAEEDEGCFYTNVSSDGKTNIHTFRAAWRTMLEQGRITEEEFLNTNTNRYIRKRKELLAPFTKEDSPVLRAGLRLVELSIKRIPCPLADLREQIKEDEHLSRMYAIKFVNVIRPWNKDVLIDGLSEERPIEERAELVEEAMQIFEDAVAASPQDYSREHCVANIHIEKVIT